MKTVTLLLFILLLFQQGLFAQDQSHTDRKDYALFFAANDYTEYRDLNNPIKNAKDIANLLKDQYGFIPEVVENPTLETIENKLDQYTEKFASGAFKPEGQLFIFFSGHGERNFFLPIDAKKNKVHRTAFSYGTWREVIDKMNCNHIIVAIDACHSISFDPNWESKGKPGFKRPGELTEVERMLIRNKNFMSRTFFTSDAQDGQTPDNSTFARKIQEALLEGGGEDGILTSTELFAYIETASPQPSAGSFGKDEAAGNFLFINKNKVSTKVLAKKSEAVNTPKPMKPLVNREELNAWIRASDCGTRDCYLSYIDKFPHGEHAIEAKAKIDDIISAEQLKKKQERERCQQYKIGKIAFQNATKFELIVAVYRYQGDIWDGDAIGYTSIPPGKTDIIHDVPAGTMHFRAYSRGYRKAYTTYEPVETFHIIRTVRVNVCEETKKVLK